MAGRALGFGWGRALAAYVAEASSSNSPRVGFTRPRLGAVLLTGVRHGGFYPNDPWYPRASEPNSPSESIRPRESKPERELDKLNRQDHMGASQTRPESKGSSSTDPMDEACEALTRWWARETSSGRDDPPPLSSRRASVLVPLSRGPDGRVQVLLCTRAASLSTHAGEVCLPGGKNDPNEGDVEAATREASEEVGLRRTDARVLASLPPVPLEGTRQRPPRRRGRAGYLHTGTEPRRGGPMLPRPARNVSIHRRVLLRGLGVHAGETHTRAQVPTRRARRVGADRGDAGAGGGDRIRETG